jgi:hypothetical protein
VGGKRRPTILAFWKTDGKPSAHRIQLKQVEHSALPTGKKETSLTKLAWIVSAIKSFPAERPSITKYPLAASALTMFIIALACVLR